MRASAAISRGRVALAGTMSALMTVTLCHFATAAPVVMAQSQPSAPAAAANGAQQQPGRAPATPVDNVKPLPAGEGASVLGKKVKGPTGEDLGLIVDVLVDPDGHPRAAVIDFGGFLGVGSRKVAIDWKSLDFTSLARTGTVELGLDRAEIGAAPEYKPGPPGAAVITTPPSPAPPVDTHQ